MTPSRPARKPPLHALVQWPSTPAGPLDTWWKRLAWAIDYKAISRRAVSRAVSASNGIEDPKGEGMVGHWCAGRVKGAEIGNVLAACAFIGDVNSYWIITGDGERFDLAPQPTPEPLTRALDAHPSLSPAVVAAVYAFHRSRRPELSEEEWNSVIAAFVEANGSAVSIAHIADKRRSSVQTFEALAKEHDAEKRKR